MESNRLAVFIASLLCTDVVKVVSRGAPRSRTSVTWGIWWSVSASEKDGERGGRFPTVRHKHLLGLIVSREGGLIGIAGTPISRYLQKESIITEGGGQTSRIDLLDKQNVFNFVSHEFQLVIPVSFDIDENASKEYRPGQQVLIRYIPMSQTPLNLVLILLLVIFSPMFGGFAVKFTCDMETAHCFKVFIRSASLLSYCPLCLANRMRLDRWSLQRLTS